MNRCPAFRYTGGMAHESALPPTEAPAKEPYSIAKLTDYWYVACLSGSLGREPKAVSILGTPLVLFRDPEGRPAALLDRCPHRNTPLSYGTATDKGLRCRYHGWEFDRAGQCLSVPGLCEPPGAQARRAPSYAAREEGGLVWVYMRANEAPVREPLKLPCLEDPRYTTVRHELSSESPVFLTLENVLDVPHTAFLHDGLFRSSTAKRDIETIVRLYGDRVEAEFIGEPRPPGLAARLLSPGGGVVEHFDRFILPTTAQVEYRLGTDSHLVITSFMTPESDFRTRQFAVLTFRTPMPGWLLKLVLTPIGKVIFGQDAEVLRRQTANLKLFGAERFVSTEADVLGLSIWRLMKDAERGKAGAGGTLVSERRTRLRL